jgi:hypothetical protein
MSGKMSGSPGSAKSENIREYKTTRRNLPDVFAGDMRQPIDFELVLFGRSHAAQDWPKFAMPRSGAP